VPREAHEEGAIGAVVVLLHVQDVSDSLLHCTVVLHHLIDGRERVRLSYERGSTTFAYLWCFHNDRCCWCG
jgi:hypothetical protein